jgi:hypothetical protein
MKAKWLLLVTGVLYLASGVVALIAPARQLALYGVEQGAIQNYMAQWAGLGSVAIGMFAFLAGRSDEPRRIRSALAVMLAYFLVSVSISVSGTLSGIMANAPGWILSAESFVLAVIYACFLLRPVDAGSEPRP